MNYNEFFNQLASDNSRNFKTHLLEVNVNDEILQMIIKYALDPFINFYIRKIPKYKLLPDNQPSASLSWALSNLDVIISRRVTGNMAIDHLRKILSSLTPDDAKVIERIIKKDLKCGISEKTVLSVWPNLLTVYPCMLCESWDEKFLKKMVYPSYVQKKEDGGRVNIIINQGKVEFRSRNGKLINLLGYYEEEFLKIADGRNLMFDGEILIDSPEEDGADRLTGNGLLNKAIRNTITKEEVEQFKFVLWDIIPYPSFLKGICKIPYNERYENLVGLPYLDEVKKIFIVETFLVNDYDSVITIFNKYILEGFEGIVLKKFDGIWENKRVQYNLKHKLVNECELRVVGVKYGDDNKYEGMITSLICESEDGIIKVDVGSGLNDYLRKTLTEEYIVGKIITSRYSTRIVDKKTGIQSLYLARFRAVREDKNVADFEKDIK